MTEQQAIKKVEDIYKNICSICGEEVEPKDICDYPEIFLSEDFTQHVAHEQCVDRLQEAQFRMGNADNIF